MVKAHAVLIRQRATFIESWLAGWVQAFFPGEEGSGEVQLYLSDPVAQVVRPARWLAGFVRVLLVPGEARRSPSGCTPTEPRSRAGTWPGWRSRARSAQ